MISTCLEHLPLVGGVILFIGVAIIIYSIHKKSIGLAKILCLIASVLLLAAAIGPKILTEDTQLSTVQVEIVDQDEEHTSWWTIWYLRGIFYPISWGNTITVEYEGQTYQLKGDDIYEKYKDKVGTHVAGTLKTTVYVDGSEHKEIVELQ